MAAGNVQSFAGRVPGGFVRTGDLTLMAKRGAPAAPWTPPPIPAGYYNPIRDIEAAEGKRGSEQALTGGERQRTNSENDFASSVAELAQREGEQGTAHQQLLARLGESFAKLKGRQEDQASATGTLYGGALLASAMMRARNEGVQRQGEETAYKNQQASDQTTRGRLARGENERLEGLQESALNTRTNQQAFQNSLQTLMASEAARNGYMAPTAPRTPAPLPGGVTRQQYQQGPGMFVRIGGRG